MVHSVNSCDLIICKQLGWVFEFFSLLNIEPVNIIMQFINSEEQRHFDMQDVYAASQSPEYFIEKFSKGRSLAFNKCVQWDKDALMFIGYTMMYIGLYEKKPLKELFNACMVQYLWDNFDIMHSQDTLYVWNRLQGLTQ